MRACFSNHSLRQILVIMACLVIVGVFAPGRTWAQSSTTLASITGDHKIASTVERMELIVKTSRILSLSDRIPRFQVHNEEILGATPVSENQIQIFAKVPGTTQVNLWDESDKLYTVDVTIVADAREVEGILNTQLPLASLKVMPINESAIVSGYVTSVDDVDKAVAIIEQFYKVVINNIEVVGVQQVLLHTKIMEVSRTKLRQLGIDWSLGQSQYAVLSGPGKILDVPRGFNQDAGFFTPFAGASNFRANYNNEFETFVEALEEQKLIKLLAEPTVVATHGRPSRFIVGGRVPNVLPGANGTLQITYEDFGTSIDFLPFVVGPGRIRLEVRPEVSETDPTRSVTAGNLNVQAFTTRYVETAVEMQAGQTFAIAGLLQSRVESTIKRTPVLGNLPLIGAFFRHTRESNNDIELLIMVTPELVDAMDPHEVPVGGPGLNSERPDDYELFHNGHIEVPNLKADNCYEDGGAECAPVGMEHTGHGLPHGGEAIYQHQGLVPGGVTESKSDYSHHAAGTDPSIAEGSASVRTATRSPRTTTKSSSQVPGTWATPEQTAASRPIMKWLRPRSVPPESSGSEPSYEGPSLFESVAGRTADRSAQQTDSSTYGTQSSVETGTLLQAGMVQPGPTPRTVGEGVTLVDPSYR